MNNEILNDRYLLSIRMATGGVQSDFDYARLVEAKYTLPRQRVIYLIRLIGRESGLTRLIFSILDKITHLILRA